MEEKEENQSFRVVDKRRFNPDGSESGTSSDNSSISASSDSSSVTKIANKTANSEIEKKSKKEDQPPVINDIGSNPDINFSAFLMGVYTQILIFLGDIPNPETNQITVNLDIAKQNIQVLSIIEEKTKGNLTPEEEHLFKEILTTVRLQFVKKVKG